MPDSPFFSSFTQKTLDGVFAFFSTSIKGLSQAEAERRLKEQGPNVVKVRNVSWLQILARQFTSSFVYLLIGAAAVSGVLGEWVDAVTILVFIAVNTGFGFYQEFRSEHTLKLLEHTVAARARVVRDGKEEIIPASSIVPGDLVMVETGDIVPADVRVIQADQLVIDESILTGESAPVVKQSEALPEAAGDIFVAQNIAFSGTSVVSGNARAVVIATGARAVVSTIATAAREGKRVSSFEKGMKGFSVFVLRLVLATLALLLLVNVLIKGSHVSWGGLILFVIALAVSVIPEALPVVITFSLSRGALRLAKNKVVARRLSSIEDLGSIEVLCTDKTGTLTENVLSVDGILGTDPRGLLVATMQGASEFDHEQKEPNNAFDRAVWNALSVHEREIVTHTERMNEIPFDPHSRMNFVQIKTSDRVRIIVRGAPEEVIHLCPHLLSGEQDTIPAWIREQGVAGRRVLAVATKMVSEGSQTSGDPIFSAPTYHSSRRRDGAGQAELVQTDSQIFQGPFEWLGIIAFVDPIKETAAHAVRKAEGLGVRVKILTGDNPEVAGSVAREIGLMGEAETVLIGSAFLALSPEEQKKAAEKQVVFARVTPEQKLFIIQTLQKRYEVGFLGEGINDAPALKSADVGIVVNDASDIARDAADIVLLKKSLNVIVDGIHEGRVVCANTIKYVKATPSSNFGNFYAVAIASLFIDFLPMLPLQILLVNLLSDFPMIAVAADRADPGELMRPRRYEIKEIALLATLLGKVKEYKEYKK